MSGLSRCRFCGARILWAKTPLGKDMPLDPVTTPAGTLVIDQQTRIVRHATKAERTEHPGALGLYTSHFATCPNATTHRRKE